MFSVIRLCWLQTWASPQLTIATFPSLQVDLKKCFIRTHVFLHFGFLEKQKLP